MNLRTVAPTVTKGGVAGLFWLSWLVIAVGFVVMAAFAAATDYFAGDLWLAHRIQDANARAFTEALDWASRLAEMPLVAAVALGGALGLWLLASRPEAIWLMMALIAPLSNKGVKFLVDRPRPAADLVGLREQASGLSFPSGHVVTAVLVYGFIFYLASFLIPARPARFLVQTSCLVVIVLTAVQRVHVGVHWPSDVLGGLLLGSLLLSLLVWTHRRYRLFGRTAYAAADEKR